MTASRWNWTTSLNSELANLLAGDNYRRLEYTKDGTLLAEVDNREGGASRWYSFDSERRPIPMQLSDDSRLGNVSKIVGEILSSGRKVELLTHKAGRRAVLLSEGNSAKSVHKIYRKDRGIEERWNLLQPHIEQSIRVPKVEAWDSQLRHLKIEYVAGENYYDICSNGHAKPEDGTRLAALVRWIQGIPAPQALPLHDAVKEIALLQDRLPTYQLVLEAPDPGVSTLVEDVCQALANCQPGPLVICHRDLYDKQIVFSDDETILLDLDLLAKAPAALDVGNMIAHIRLRSLQQEEMPWQEIVSKLLATLPASTVGQVNTWVAATLVRLLLIYSRRRRSEHLLEHLATSARSALAAQEEWDGLLV